jgi:(1->4)-alpha-D-glucan 1-alpha-D-glucosylmutase
VLSDQYGVILENGEIMIRFDPREGSFSAWYFDHRFPISPRSYREVLEGGGETLAALTREWATIDLASGPKTGNT